MEFVELSPRKEVIELANLEEKQIAKEILLEMLKKGLLFRNEYHESRTDVDMVCAAYKEILKAVSGVTTEHE